MMQIFTPSLFWTHWLELCQMVRQNGSQNLYEAHQRADIYHRAVKKGLSQECALVIAKRFSKKRLPKIVFVTWDETIEVLHETLRQALKELTGRDLTVELIREKWDFRFRCRLGEFRHLTEWFDLQKVTKETGTQIILKEAQLIRTRLERFQRA